MAKKAFVYDGTNWIDIAQSTTDLTNYANMTTTPISGFRNAIINGNFDIWQRGTTFSAGGYTADRWLLQVDGSGATRAITRQTFTPGNAIAGYEPIFYLRYNQSVAGSGATYNILDQRIEDVRTYAGQAVTVSFWAKAAANVSTNSSIQQVFGSGGSSEVAGLSSATLNLTTSWQRFTYTGTLASISGKTVGTDSYIAFRLNLPLNTTFTIDLWGVQIEKGSIATPVEQRPIGTELALCQRYFSQDTFHVSGVWGGGSGEVGICAVPFKVTMRDNPVIARVSGGVAGDGAVDRNVTSITTNQVSKHSARVLFTVASAGTVGRGCDVYNIVLSLSAEL
jgi:hypothetical protein